jgi:thimet oligopeptidase
MMPMTRKPPAAAQGAAAALPPGFAELDAQQLQRRCETELAQRRARLAQMEAQRLPGRILEEFNELSVMTGGFDDPLGVLQNAAPDAELRAAAQACLEQLVPFGTELFQSAKLYARVAALQPGEAQDASYRQWLIEQFEDAGATLPEDQRAQVKAIQDELNTLSLRFQRNVNDVTATVAVSPAEAEGLGEDWRQARRRDDVGNYLVGMDYPSFGPFMELAADAQARKRVWMEFQNRAGAANLELMDRALQLRWQLAQCYGYPDYATFALRRKMAGSPQAVTEFLQSVKAAVDRVEARELEELRHEKALVSDAGGGAAADASAPGGVTVERWDLGYLQQRIKRSRYNVDQEALRAYFPTDAAVRFVMRVAEKLYGIRFVARDEPVWHADVRYYEVRERRAESGGGATDAPSPASGGFAGKILGAIYLDLFPRAGKFSHAAVFGVRRGSVLAGQNPIKALVCNFNDKGLTPAELETLFHEFGHALHGVLSRARYADQSGTAVRQDFVEAPSIMFEEWARREISLRGFAEVCPQCPALDSQLIAQMAAARNFGAGIRYARQWLFAAYDLALHTGAPVGALAAWERMEGATRLGHVPGTMMPASFSHLMGGYEAGYYSYMWSEVLALDMLSAFQGNLLDPVVGQRYRRSILEPGGSRPPQELVEEFLARKPNSQAFYAEITGQR